ncbi:MAG: methionine--tRNA ligase [Candidatus Aminicenantes bacterium]|nr:methionine--tRNA ligase [Candidatus Aminicenantes bacterium]
MEKKSKPTFSVTTPIYYVNDIPHIGHAYTTIIADALARHNRLAGREVFFLTGTDEHGQKIEKAAAERGITPLQLADSVVTRTQDLWKALDISYDLFIRTTMEIHEKGVQKLFKALVDKGDIYKGEYKGWYCVSDEAFLPADAPAGKDGAKICPDCGKAATVVSEETYFFRLSAYQQKLLDHFEAHPEFVRPQSRMNEVASFVRGGLRDLSITRTTVKWGVPVPGDPAHTIYVWFDALHNYVTGLGWDWDMERFDKFWPASLHLMGKDILRFHAVYWPAFLMASGLALPDCILGHGWWLKDEAKMSKSRGNVLDPYVLINAMGPDPLRYFLLREIPIGLDGNFSHEGFIHRVNSDLANDFGNLVHRTLTMVRQYFGGTLETPAEERTDDLAIREAFEKTRAAVLEHYEAYAPAKALEELWAFIGLANKYLADNVPWKLAKDPEQRRRLARVLWQTAAAIRGASHLVAPVMPGSARKIWDLLGETRSPLDVPYAEFRFDDLDPARPMKAPVPLFPRIDLKEFLGRPGEAGPIEPAPAAKETTMDIITYEEFKKLDLRVGLVLKAERVEGATRLLKLQIDLGTEERQIVAGVAETYAPEDLVGKRFTVIANLKPAVIRGVESQGMLLAGIKDGKAYIPFFEGDIPPGSKVQ